MNLVQILLPAYDNGGKPIPGKLFEQVRDELTNRFGGLTAYTRAPASGHWRQRGKTIRDDIVVFEVMAETLDRAWWKKYRHKLEKLFKQESIVVRSQKVRLL